ncbi:MAG: hypothetical protein ACFHWX_16390 [Bacteroidota bacterium]
MPNIQKIFIIVLVTFMFSSCEENNPNPKSNYLIFGRFAGFCTGENCIRIFKLDSSQVSEDTLDKYPSRTDFYEGAFVKLNQSKFEIASTLFKNFPEEIFNEMDTVFGCPDCADQGGYYLEVKQGELHKFWILDSNTGSIPEYLHIFIDELQGVLEQIET